MQKILWVFIGKNSVLTLYRSLPCLAIKFVIAHLLRLSAAVATKWKQVRTFEETKEQLVIKYLHKATTDRLKQHTGLTTCSLKSRRRLQWWEQNPKWCNQLLLSQQRYFLTLPCWKIQLELSLFPELQLKLFIINITYRIKLLDDDWLREEWKQNGRKKITEMCFHTNRTILVELKAEKLNKNTGKVQNIES